MPKNPKTPKPKPTGKTPSRKNSQPKKLPATSNGRKLRKGTLPVKGWITCTDAATIIGCHKDYVRYLARNGKLEATQHETIPDSGLYYWMINPKSVQEFVGVKQTTGYPRGRPR